MEPTAENMGHLVGFLSQTVSADPAARKAAEAQLGAAKVQQGYALLLLRVVVAPDAPPDVLRNIYESAKMTGEISNTNKHVMLHNFIKSDDNDTNDTA